MTHNARHRTAVQVRFRDIDAFGHVNNAVFFTYLEMARIRYFLDVLSPDGPFQRLPLILARVEIDFRSPILIDEEVAIESSVVRIGRASIGMDHRMLAGADARVAAEAQTVLVTYDYQAARPMPVPDAWRRSIADHEGRDFDTDTPVPEPAVAG